MFCLLECLKPQNRRDYVNIMNMMWFMGMSLAIDSYYSRWLFISIG